MKKIALIFILCTLIIVSCKNDEKRLELAQKTAQGFAVTWQQKEYDQLYNYFHPTLKSKRNLTDFVRFVELSQSSDISSMYLVYDKVVLQDKDLAYAYYTFSGGLFEGKAPAIEMNYINGEWKINGFAHYFSEECAEDCSEVLGEQYLAFAKDKCRITFELPSGRVACEAGYSLATMKYICDKSTDFRCRQNWLS